MALRKANDESKDRRSARAEVLGKAKVMGYDELQAKRAVIAAAKAAEAQNAALGPKNGGESVRVTLKMGLRQRWLHRRMVR